MRVDVIVDVQNSIGRHGKQERISYGYVCHYINWKPRKVFQVYRKRFDIESSYRMKNRTKARTSSKDPKLRYLYSIVSMMVKNFWVMLKWVHSLKLGKKHYHKKGFEKWEIVTTLGFYNYICIAK